MIYLVLLFTLKSIDCTLANLAEDYFKAREPLSLRNLRVRIIRVLRRKDLDS